MTDFTPIIHAYYNICVTRYPDDHLTCWDIYPGDSDRMVRCAAEMAYVYEHHALPEWVTVLQEVQIVNGSYIFVHRDVSKVN